MIVEHADRVDREADPSLLVTDSQVAAVRIVDAAETVLAAFKGSPRSPLVSMTLSAGPLFVHGGSPFWSGRTGNPSNPR